MQDTELRSRSAPAFIVGVMHQSGSLSPRPFDFQEGYEASLQRLTTERVLSGYSRSPIEVEGLGSRDLVSAARTARLAAENARLRAQETLLLDQLAARDAELAARDAVIVDLRAQLSSRADEVVDEIIPHELSGGEFRVRAKFGAFRRGVPFIHPEEFSVEDE